MPMRWRITIEYDGSAFSGWQRQENADTIQERLELALHSLTGEAIIVHGAGRTDSGVHAKGQVAHFDLPDDISARFSVGGSGSLIGAFKHHLGCDSIAVIEAEPVDSSFDARFSAIHRYYEYSIILRSAPTALMRHYAWQVSHDLDIEAMMAGAERFCGEHDFTSFRATACQAKNPIRTLDRLDIMQTGENLLIKAEARSFLHHQVRNMVGALVFCGRHLITAETITELLLAKDRSLSPPTAPSHGLCLTRVQYK